MARTEIVLDQGAPPLRASVELIVATLAASVLAVIVDGIFGVAAFVAFGAGLQLLAAAGYGPTVWPGTSRLADALRFLPCAVVFWGGVVLVLPKATDQLSAQEVLLGVAAGVPIYVLLGSLAARRVERAAWALPLAAAAGWLPLVLLLAVRSAPAHLPPASGALLGTSSHARLRGGEGMLAGGSLLAAADLGVGGHAFLVGSPAPGYGSGEIDLVVGSRPVRTSLGAYGGHHLRIVGPGGASAGFALATIGDQDHGGHRDLLVGAPLNRTLRDGTVGAVYVLDLSGTRHRVDLSHLGRHDWRIDGAFIGDQAGYSLADAGDVNGDGIDDVAVGVPRFGVSGQPTGSGAVYIVYGGHTGSAPVRLATFGKGPPVHGYRMISVNAGTAGISVAGIGDINSDGKPDLAIGVPDVSLDGRDEAGGVYVVYGQTKVSTINLALLGSRGDKQGFRIDGAYSGDQAGRSIAAVGDVNGDGRPDLLIGAYKASAPGRPDSGQAYVIYGKPHTGIVDLRNVGKDPSLGFRIDGAAGSTCLGVPCGDEAGRSVASAGDVNGDGRPDLLIGAPGASIDGKNQNGAVYVVYAPPAGTKVIDLAYIGTRGNHQGFRIDGEASGDLAGTAVASAGDLNGDGVPDVLVGAPESAVEAGTAYAVLSPPRR
jgi:hypothetical protein